MLAALEAIRGGCSIKRAALERRVPRTTLYDRHTGRVVHGTKPGPQPYLNKAEEAELRDFVAVVGQIEYGKIRRQIKDIAEAVARDKGILKKKISDGWLRCFFERQPSLSL